MSKVLLLSVVLLASVAFAQSTPANYYSAGELTQSFQKLAAQAKAKNSGSTGSDLDCSGNSALKLSYRRQTGGAEVHQHFDDIMVVEGGSATIVTGGSLVDPKSDGRGEIKGKSITGGIRHVLTVGDVIHIVAGTPHQVIVDRGTDFRALVVKVHE